MPFLIVTARPFAFTEPVLSRIRSFPFLFTSFRVRVRMTGGEGFRVRVTKGASLRAEHMASPMRLLPLLSRRGRLASVLAMTTLSVILAFFGSHCETLRKNTQGDRMGVIATLFIVIAGLFIVIASPFATAQGRLRRGKPLYGRGTSLY